jgi:hypothetical protein
MTERRPAGAVRDAESPTPGAPRGFRPASRRRTRIAAGAALVAVAIGGNVLVYSSLDDSTEVVQVVNDIRAGQQITAADIRTVDVELDPTVPALTEEGLVVGQYARVFIASGSFVAPQFVQSRPLVTEGAKVVAIELRPTRVPSGLTERSQVDLVLGSGTDGPTLVVPGRVVSRPDEASTSGTVSISVEVSAGDAALVATADTVNVVLVDPGADPALLPRTDQPATVEEATTAERGAGG